MPFAVYALAIAAFAVGTAEFVISGLLPLLSVDLGVSIPTAGLLVTAYAVGVAIGGPLLTVATARFSQRAVLIGVMVLFTFSQVLCAFAPDYGLLLAARVASSIGHGAFFGAGSVIVANLVAPERHGVGVVHHRQVVQDRVVFGHRHVVRQARARQRDRHVVL